MKKTERGSWYDRVTGDPKTRGTFNQFERIVFGLARENRLAENKERLIGHIAQYMDEESVKHFTALIDQITEKGLHSTTGFWYK